MTTCRLNSNGRLTFTITKCGLDVTRDRVEAWAWDTEFVTCPRCIALMDPWERRTFLPVDLLRRLGYGLDGGKMSA